jgi:hypothetical protein
MFGDGPHSGVRIGFATAGHRTPTNYPRVLGFASVSRPLSGRYLCVVPRTLRHLVVYVGLRLQPECRQSRTPRRPSDAGEVVSANVSKVCCADRSEGAASAGPDGNAVGTEVLSRCRRRLERIVVGLIVGDFDSDISV